MTKKLSWRLSKLPTPDEVRELVKDKIITQDEARDILFSSETEEERDVKSLETEIKFLRALVDKLANGKTQIIQTIEKVQVPYKKYDWYQPYLYYCNGGTTTTASVDYNLIANSQAANSVQAMTAQNLSEIKTF